MAEALRKKVSKRRGYREVLLKRLTEADTVLREIETSRERADPVKMGQLKLSISEKLEVLKRLDDDIIDLTDNEDDIIKDISDTDEFNENAYQKLAHIESHLTGKITVTSGVEASSIPSQSKAKLPKLNLPCFKGDITEWTTFWDLYSVAVHTNTSLSPIEKFTYLRTLLSHTAAEAISGLTLSAANYDEAVEILQSRFGNKEKIIAKHMEALLDLDSSSNNLRTLYDKVESHTRELKALGVPEEAYNCLLPSLIMKKLPKELALSLSRKIAEDDWNLMSIMRELNNELKARERMQQKTSVNEQVKHSVYNNDRKPRDLGYKRMRDPPTASALLAQTSHCCYCDGSHAAEACTKLCKIDDRKQFIRSSGRCFVCLRQGHLSRACRSNIRCKRCNGRHHCSICVKGRNTDSEGSNDTPSNLSPTAIPFTCKSPTLFSSTTNSILLQTAQAVVYNDDHSRCEILKVIFDNGSQRSYITSSARERLSLKLVGRMDLFISTFSTSKSKKRTCDVVKAIMKTKEGEELSLILLTTPVICEPVNCEFVSDSVRNCKHLQNIELAKPAGDGETIEFDILIGLDHYWDLITGEIIKGLDGPTAVYSKLGWILSGPTITESNVLMTHILTTGVKAAGEKSRLEEQLKSFWELESLGILEHEASLYDQFKNHVTHDGVRYEVTLPWKSNVTSLPDNYELSLSRLKGLLRRLRRDTNLLNEYNSCIKNQIDTDVVEIIDNPSIIDGGKVHYLPHHAVIRQDKLTTKMRIVYDASAKGNGLSLNECLHAGPKFNQQIFELLIRFRLHKHAFIADVEKAFLMISIHKNDRDVLRFLWVKDPHKDPIEIQVLRFKRVAFGITASPFLLNATMRYHIESFKDDKPEIVHKLLRSVYVDDVISGTDSREQSIAIFEQFREMLSLGGFNLRKYISAGDMHLLQSDERGETQKVLGLNWDIRKDELIFDLSYIAKECNTRNPTKRYIVSVTSKIYDPIGFIAPVTLQFKIFLQALHCARIDWDEPIQNELLEHWAELISHIKNAKPIIVPRCYFSIDYKKCQLKLVGFSDSSVKAYGAVIYLWYFDGETTGMTIVASKTRVAPIKSQTIPRLELMGALLLARLITCVYNSLTPELVLLPSVCYIDSQVVLYWIKGEDKEWKPFVYNRVKEIRELVSSCHWKHCAGQRNPADIASRGATVNELVRSELWWNGPVELEEGRKVWVEMPTECTDELRSTTRKECGLLISESSRAHLSNIIDIHCHSTLNKLLVVTAYVLKFVKMLRFFHTHRDQSEEINEIVGFLDQAEILWIKEVQGQLEKNRNFLKWKAQLRLFKDESKIWRCGGRLAHAELPYETKHPVVLPGSHYFTKLVVKRAHERVFHNGVKETLNEIRSRFWILKGRSVVR